MGVLSVLNPSGNPVLEARGLSKRFGDRAALDGVTFSLQPGEVMGYVGPNGAGKTTTLRIVTGTETDFQGELSVQGFPMPGHRGRVYGQLGYMPQAVAFGGWRTAGETLRLLGRLSGMAEDRLARRVPEALERVGLAQEERTRLKAFSGGMRQRLGLAQAILHEPGLLVLDEPFNHLDPAGRVHLKQVLGEMNQQGVSILFSSHILSDVEELVHRLAVIHRGRLNFLGTPKELRAAHPVRLEVEVGGTMRGEATKLVVDTPGVVSVRRDPDGAITFGMRPEEEPEAVTTRVLSALIGAGCSIRHVRPMAPSLEEMIAGLAPEEVQP